MEVIIHANGKDGSNQEVFRCAQRDLFRKNNWPAGTRIMIAMEEFQSAMKKE